MPSAPKPLSKQADSPQQGKKPKKRGRPLVFDEVRRAEFLGMLRSGCTIRHAARRIGIDPATVRRACRQDSLFADRLDRAQQERDLYFVRRIQNAGEKSWRAAAWLLERVEPREFSLRQKNADPWTVRGKRRLKKFVTDIVNAAIADRLETNARHPTVDRALRLVEDRLAELESQGIPYDDSQEPESADSDLNRGAQEDDSLGDDDHARDDLDDDEPDEDFVENDGCESEEAAVESYRRLLRKLNRR